MRRPRRPPGTIPHLVNLFTSSHYPLRFPRYSKDMPTTRDLRGPLMGLACAFTLVALTFAAPQRRDQTIYITVTDKAGATVQTLGPDDITVREDGAAREVLKVTGAGGPMQVALLVDTSSASAGSIPDLRAAVRAFADQLWAKNQDTQIALWSFGERPQLLADFSTGPAALGRGVDRLFAGTGSGAYFLDAVMEASAALRKRDSARAVVVAFVDENGPEFSNRRNDHVQKALTEARASLWTIVRQGFGGDALSPENRERSTVIGDVTPRTGGRTLTIFAPSALKERFTTVAEHLLGQLAVTYTRPETLVPPEKLEVKLKNSALKLQAPRWAMR